MGVPALGAYFGKDVVTMPSIQNSHMVCYGHVCVTDDNFVSIVTILAAAVLFVLPILYYIS